MLVTKNTPISAIEYTETIFIDKEVSLDTHFLEQIMQTFPLSKIIIQTYDLETHTGVDSSVLYTTEELETLAKNTNLAKEKYIRSIKAIDECDFVIFTATIINGKLTYNQPEFGYATKLNKRIIVII
jgi:hypothetical protein